MNKLPKESIKPRNLSREEKLVAKIAQLKTELRLAK